MKKIIGLSFICGIGLILFFKIKKIEQLLVPNSIQTNIDTAGAIRAQEESVPLTHLACIMDGNRRWAKKKGLIPWYGHQEGIEAVRRVVKFCLEKKIPYLSLYTFSLENFNRSYEENSFLFDLMRKEALKGVDEFRKYGVRIRFIGDRDLFPEQLKPILEEFEHKTADLHTLEVAILFCYGARQEIAQTTKAIVQQVQAGIITLQDITPEMIQKNLWTHDFPNPDLIIRTGGFSRLSNFLLFQAAYSELYFIDCLWPDITGEHLQKAYDFFIDCKRNFGR